MKTLKLNSRNRRAGIKSSNGSIPALEIVHEPIRIDIGCGPNKKPGFIGCDQTAFPNVDVVADLNKTWPWKDSTVDEAHSSHCLEHFDSIERVHFLNELWRVLKPGAKATIITPHWASCRSYGDPTHKWPPMSEFLWFYLKKDWRMANAPHTDAQHLSWGYKVNFEVTWGYSLNPEVAVRNQEYQQYAMTFLKEAAQDMIATLVAVKP
jgi:SAM-dependent methyltransferase